MTKTLAFLTIVFCVAIFATVYVDRDLEEAKQVLLNEIRETHDNSGTIRPLLPGLPQNAKAQIVYGCGFVTPQTTTLDLFECYLSEAKTKKDSFDLFTENRNREARKEAEYVAVKFDGCGIDGCKVSDGHIRQISRGEYIRASAHNRGIVAKQEVLRIGRRDYYLLYTYTTNRSDEVISIGASVRTLPRNSFQRLIRKLEQKPEPYWKIHRVYSENVVTGATRFTFPNQ